MSGEKNNIYVTGGVISSRELESIKHWQSYNTVCKSVCICLCVSLSICLCLCVCVCDRFCCLVYRTQVYQALTKPLQCRWITSSHLCLRVTLCSQFTAHSSNARPFILFAQFQATGYARQHIWCLSQARINREDCARKGVVVLVAFIPLQLVALSIPFGEISWFNLPYWKEVCWARLNCINMGFGCFQYQPLMPSVLWCCWLGGRNGIRPVKNWVLLKGLRGTKRWIRQWLGACFHFYRLLLL